MVGEEGDTHLDMTYDDDNARWNEILGLVQFLFFSLIEDD